MEFVCDLEIPDNEGYRSNFRIPKVDDMIDSNSCHMRSIRPSHNLGGLWAFVGVTMKVLEVPKSLWIQGIRSNSLSEVSSTIY
jgi:hypothetical protein